MDKDEGLNNCYLACVIVLAIIFPPLAVLLVYGCRLNFFINLLLTLLFYIPGLIHAILVIMDKYNQQQTSFSTDNC